MKSDVSALLDGELEAHEAKAAFAALRDEGELRRAWDEYQTIGAALRHEDRLGACLATRVMADLAHDVTVLAPRSLRPDAWHRPLLALAASVAGVAVVGWVAFSAPLSPAPVGAGSLATAVPTQPATIAVVSAAATVSPGTRREMQDYLAAHQAHVPAAQILGGTQHIRTVSVGVGGERR
jgi:sigma-E factor negative regulatory protein RseA